MILEQFVKEMNEIRDEVIKFIKDPNDKILAAHFLQELDLQYFEMFEAMLKISEESEDALMKEVDKVIENEDLLDQHEKLQKKIKKDKTLPPFMKVIK